MIRVTTTIASHTSHAVSLTVVHMRVEALVIPSSALTMTGELLLVVARAVHTVLPLIVAILPAREA